MITGQMAISKVAQNSKLKMITRERAIGGIKKLIKTNLKTITGEWAMVGTWY